MKNTSITTMNIVCTFKFRPDIRLWDAIKLRIMGRAPTARIMTYILQSMKDAS